MQTILVTGGNGYIARSIYRHLCNQYNITLINRDTLDLINYNELEAWIKNQFFDVVIHTAINGGSRLKTDTNQVIDNNLQMYYNLLRYKNINYNKFISIGSGAEFIDPESPYGLSKRIINKSINLYNNFYNLRIYGIFDENELDTRFIKNNLKRYISYKSIEIYQNKFMDFIHMADFISILQHTIINDSDNKEIDCVYTEKYSLLDIANIINQLSDYAVPININNESIAASYIGRNVFNFSPNKLLNRIKEVYTILSQKEINHE